MKRIICWLRTIKYTFNRFTHTGEVTPYVSGHSYVEKSTQYIKARKRFEQKLVCEVCGDISISWWN
jgi:hypothetical protein